MLSQIEKSVYCTKPLEKTFDHKKYNRFYYGSEFCEYLIPDISEIDKIINYTFDQKKKFTLLTPFVTDMGVNKLDKIFKSICSYGKDIEIVISDYGILELIKTKGYKFSLVLGRMLNQQKRGPRLLKLIDKVPKELISHFSSCYLDRQEVYEYLLHLGVERIEFDNIPLGLKRPSYDKFKASIYYPYIYLSTTRLCLARKAFKDTSRLRLIEKCEQECKVCEFTLNHKCMPEEISLKGNTYFTYCKNLPENLEDLNIDRIVFEPDECFI